MIEYRELKEGEIPFAVSAYEEMMTEIGHNEEIIILPTEKTLKSIYVLLKSNYLNDIKSYVAVENKLILGYVILISDSLMFDLKEKAVYILGLFIEKEYRNKNIIKPLLAYVEDQLKLEGVKYIFASFTNGRVASEKVMKRYNMKKLTSFYKKI